DCKVGCDCDRYLEIWNLVFMQYNRDKEGTLNPLPHPSIDTGMGLERITAVKQGVKSNFDCDLFAPLIDRIKELAVNQQPVSLNVIADHIRTAAFLITDGALPGNEGRGYVLRRIIRRAIRHGRMLGITEPFFYRLTETISRQMKEQYPGLEENVNFVSGILQNEEERFASTLERGLRELAGIQAEAEQAGQKEISGSRLFQLYDTFGFPLDLAGEILQDNGFTLDRAGYETAMAEQQKRARSAGKTGGKEAPLQVYQELSKEIPDTDFLGYDQVEGEATVSALIAEGKAVSEITAGQSAEIILDRTPFYAEGGGQASDSGNVYTSDGNFQVDKVDCKINRIFFHTGRVLTGRISVGDKIQAVVNGENRNASAANHTATHLLQAALRMVLGDRIKQAGSSVRAEGLRFDFTHLKPVTDDELSGIQAEVNRKIRENIPVKKETMPLAEAMKIDGLMALFEDKYQRHVRVVRIPGFSAELCGGIHAERTGDIGFFKIRSEEGVAAGIRRIWALTGEKAYGETARESGLLKELGAVLKASAPELPDKVEKLLRQIKDQEKEISRLTDKLFSQEAKQVKPEKIGDHYFLQKSLPDETGMKEMMSFCDEWRNQFSQKYPSDRYLTLVSSLSNGKVNLVCASTIPELPANKCITDLTVPIMGGGGGGRPEMAKAGGGDPAKLPAFVEAVRQKLIDEKG
ncbi:MAG: alanine--tRNA ligase, partial [bacterium]